MTTIITNNQPRDLIVWEQLSAKEQKEFDWMDETQQQDGHFWRYRGNVYSDQDFMRPEGITEFKNWDGYASDSFFSGTLVKLVNDNEQVIVGRYYT